jgi:hypothetical protein
MGVFQSSGGRKGVGNWERLGRRVMMARRCIDDFALFVPIYDFEGAG